MSQNVIFAEGLCFYKMFCVFVIGAIIGDLIETVFCYVKDRKITSRSSFVFGRMSVVWGFAFLIASFLAYSMENARYVECIIAGMVFGGIFEYLCSFILEKFMGTRFWDYSEMPCNINGRINLQYCFYWGLAALVWMKGIYPLLELVIESIPARIGTVVCNIAFVVVLVDALISVLAIRRYVERKKGSVARNKVMKWIDQIFTDTYMCKVYPRMTLCENKEVTEKYKEKVFV